jgi:site-specific DNA-methyltransferase (adenine-specific)
MMWNDLELPDNPYYQDGDVIIYNSDCRDILPQLPKVDLVLTDPPYGITSNIWDKPFTVREFWEYIEPVSDRYLITACQPYSSLLVAATTRMFKHEWIWLKNRGSNFANTVREPMKEHEHILFW